MRDAGETPPAASGHADAPFLRGTNDGEGVYGWRERGSWMSTYQLQTPAFTCLVLTFYDKITDQEIVTRESAPVVRWAHGKPIAALRQWCDRKWPLFTEWRTLEDGKSS
jgi:hypothetical protein